MEPNPRLLQLMFAYKRAADRELVDYLRSIKDVIAPDVGRAVRRQLDHINVVDQIFKAHLCGVPHSHDATATSGDPGLENLDLRFAEAASWYEEFASSIGHRELTQSVRFVFTDGKLGTMTRLEILLHVASHAAYHRGAAWALLRMGIGTPASTTVAGWLHSMEPSRRDHLGTPALQAAL